VALLLVWLMRWIITGRPGTETPLDVPLLLLMSMIPIAVWASVLPELSLPFLTRLILGLATFRATMNAVRTPRHFTLALALFLALGLSLTMIGLVSATWLNKWAALQPVLAHIPQFVERLPGSEAGVHPNQVAGMLLFFVPVSLALGLMPDAGRQRMVSAVRVIVLLLTLLFGAVLVLTQSRSAWIGVTAGLGVMVWIQWPRMRWLLIAAVLILTLVLWYIGPQVVAAALFPTGMMASTVTLEGRIELWSRALYALQDFPFTGCGLGSFGTVVHLLYPLFLVGPEFRIWHAHNLYFQVALDLGLPGLIAYLALVGTALWIGLRVAQGSLCDTAAASPQYRWLGLGIVGSLVAFHVYGLTDTVALGAKAGVAFWMLLALAAALWTVLRKETQCPSDIVEPVGLEGE
jgi:putative inorganic carbon (HCO3(-)) transporter